MLQLRTYYFDQESTSGAPSKAWALGGWVGARSPWWGEVFQAAVNFYTSQRLYGPENEGGTKLLQSDQAAINVLGEAFGAIRFAGQTFTGYRQLINRPFVNPQDNRMVPNTFEAYTLSVRWTRSRTQAGTSRKRRLRDTESFRWMSNVAGGSGSQEGVAFAGATWNFAKNGYVRVDEQYAFDVFNTFYADVRYTIVVDDKTAVALGAAVLPADVGRRRAARFVLDLGLRPPGGGRLRAGRRAALLDADRHGARHAEPVRVARVVPRPDAGVVQHGRREGVGHRRQRRLREPGRAGLTAAAIYAQGRDRLNYTTGAPMPDRNETDVRVDYAFAKGSVLEGFSATFRYSWLDQDGAAQTGTQLRAYVNYAVRF